MQSKHFMLPLLKLSQGFLLNNTFKVLRNPMSTLPNYKTLSVTAPKPFVYHVQLNRPEKLNAVNQSMWDEIKVCFDTLGDQDDCRVIILSGNGRIFSAGIDLTSLMGVGQKVAEQEDVARKCKILHATIHKYQDTITSLEKCVKPVIGLIHNACIGAGFDLITATDIRYCTEDVMFQIKEVDIGMAADVGTLQRLPKIVGNNSLTNELAFTARKLLAPEAKEYGLVNRVFKDKDSMVSGALEIAEEISKKSPVSVQMTKRSLIYSRDHTVQESLNHIADWNQVMLQSEDFINATTAQATKSPPPIFAKL